MTKTVCAVIGVGAGVGTTIAKKYSQEGYALAVTARSNSQIDNLAKELPDTYSYVYDVQDTNAANQVINQIETDIGTINTLVYNAGAGTWGSIDEISVENLQASWEVNTRGLFQAVTAVLPQMRKAGHGHIIVIGATASLRGGVASAAFASAKAAQRSLAQSMARHLSQENIHVAYVIIDGVINMQRTREMMPDKEDGFFMDPEQIADSVYFLSTQKQQAWTFELDLRPYKEKW
jgi:NADP-dependent 3-hydroxy acid dehydrogenase YdfG